VFTLQRIIDSGERNARIQYSKADQLTEDRWVKAFEVRRATQLVHNHRLRTGRRRGRRHRRRAPPARPRLRRPRGLNALQLAPGMQDRGRRSRRQARPNNDRPAPQGGTGPFVADFARDRRCACTRRPALRVRAARHSSSRFTTQCRARRQTDRSRIGWCSAKEKPKTEVMIAACRTATFHAAGRPADVRVDAEMTLNRDHDHLELLPHTHVRVGGGVSGDLS